VTKARGNRPPQWLEKVSGAWEELQTGHARDAIYGYLEAVFAIVEPGCSPNFRAINWRN
jgi:hypothetical protein